MKKSQSISISGKHGSFKMIFAFHVECMKDFVDIGLSVGIQKKYPLTTWAGKVFVEDRQPVTVPVLLTWFQGKSDL